MAASKFMSNLSRTFSNSGFSRTYSSAPKPFHFTQLHQAQTSPLPVPATQKRAKKGRKTCKAICCCCFTACVSLVVTSAIALGITALIIWLVIRPVHTPTYDIRNVTVSQFAYDSNSRALTAAASYVVVAYNGNGKIGIKYDSITVDSSYQAQVFDHTVIPGFYHGHLENKTLPVSFATPAAGVTLDAIKGAALQMNIKAQAVPLLMRVDVKARLKVGAITTPSFMEHVNCDLTITPPVGSAPAQVLKQSCRKV